MPGAANPQSWNRYSYVGNSPINFSDPTGHMRWEGEGGNLTALQKARDAQIQATHEKEAADRKCARGNRNYCDNLPAGFQVQLTFALGMPSNTYRGSEPVRFLVFYGLSIVGDFHGGLQLYGLTRDIKFNPTLEQGPAEEKYPSSLLSYSLTGSAGLIFGTDFKNRGTEAYDGRSVDHVFGVGPISYDSYEYFDPSTGETDPSIVRGEDIGYGFGAPFSMGSFAMYAHQITPRIGFPIP